MDVFLIIVAVLVFLFFLPIIKAYAFIILIVVLLYFLFFRGRTRL